MYVILGRPVQHLKERKVSFAARLETVWGGLASVDCDGEMA